MKKLHLLCNAHLDPAWLWRWNAGQAEAISTFRVAADFCEEYEGFVFNHNEAVLYEWIEEHEPQLFERIKKLVEAGKWVIVGGWYLQPDCVMLSGESFLSQIRLGQAYFKEKFGVVPKIAFNVDSFGHSRGLVQILNKTGYEGYLIGRPGGLPVGCEFLWEGFDGSRIVGHLVFGAYSSQKGKALQKIQKAIKSDKDIGLCLWGIGNHGGGPSREDLETLKVYMTSADCEIIHSSADAYLAEVNIDNLPVIARSLTPCMIGCYTSMVRIKQGNRRAENKIAETEKILSYAGMQHVFDYDARELQKAKKALAFCQFHDILPGTSIKSVEDDALKSFGYIEEITDKLYQKAFMCLCEGQCKAEENTIPIMVFNPHPYEIRGVFDVEFILQSQNRMDDETTVCVVYDEKGNSLPSQNEKPECTFNMDWTKKVCFYGTLAPSSITRFNGRLERIKADPTTLNRFTSKPEHCGQGESDIIEVKNSYMCVRISKKTGLIAYYEVNGKQYIQNSGLLEVYRDDEDPWAMNVEAFTDKEGVFHLMSEEEANAFLGYPKEHMSNVRIVEDGAVRTKIQAFFAYNRSTAVMEYSIPKQAGYMDVYLKIFPGEPNRMIKYHLDTTFAGTPYGETAFGYEELDAEEKEAVFHKWCGIRSPEEALYIMNTGIYGGSFTKNSMKLSLLRTPVYACHPIGTLNDNGDVIYRTYAPHDRYLEHMDMGEREFSFRITTEVPIACAAQIFNEKPCALSFYPSGEGVKAGSSIVISDPNVLLSSLRKQGNQWEMTLYNAQDVACQVEVTLVKNNRSLSLYMEKHEIRMLEI